MPTSVSVAGFRSRRRAQRQRRQLARAIDAQQRQPVVLVLGDALGIAEPGGDDHLAALRELAVGDDMALRAHHQPVAVFDRFRQRRERRAALGERREGARHRHHHRRDDAFHHLIEQHGEAAHLAVAHLRAHGKFLQALHAADEEIVVVQHAVFDLARRRLLLLLLEQRGSLRSGSLMRKVSTCTSPCADDQRVPCAASRACGTILVGRPMRMPVAGSTTTLQPNSCSCAWRRRAASARSAASARR